jgi:hypothetical protein
MKTLHGGLDHIMLSPDDPRVIFEGKSYALPRDPMLPSPATSWLSRRAEGGGLAAVPEARRIEIFIKELLKFVVRRHLMALAAFLMQAQPPALAARKVILDLHRDDGADAGEALDYNADQRLVPQADEPRHLGFFPSRRIK